MKHLVKKYLLGQLNPEETTAFEKELQSNTELQALLEFYEKNPLPKSFEKDMEQRFEKVLENQSPVISLKEIDDYHKDKMSMAQRMAFEKKLQKNPQMWEKVMQKKSNTWQNKKNYAIIAAACTVLAVSSFVFWNYYQRPVAHLYNLSVVDMSQQPTLVFEELFSKASKDGKLVDTLQSQLISVLKNPEQVYEVLEKGKPIKKITAREFVSVFKTENYNRNLGCGFESEDVQKNSYVFMLVKPNEDHKKVGNIYTSLQNNKIVIDSICIDSIQIKPSSKITQ